ncbi:rod shape-determining protein RodA [Mucilaginibacter myungsuensis]|uniref:Rod shape-determining protein RodA n=1 Tax=Mucilaginibacter myungsuensis TaxID=649104 RepID=A0A929KYG3_9SPHI|nr:rod shape-determining protein RodA [Mucilaginibacter myungsuensis]MBE9663477.1 rod shape-determining protein RodA [Mucilaginibacter myungsuensis]MDN3600215.1 rod shape-determining protein RodA [Mucilaginibacter myungsuensis]
MRNEQRSLFFNVDWLLILIYVALCMIGWFNIRAAVFDPEHTSLFDTHTRYGSQFIFLIVAFVVGTVILLLESRFLSALAPTFYVATVLLLILVLVIGRNVGGNQAWIDIGGGFRLQPSEFAKYSTCLLLARYLSGVNIKVTEIKSFLIAGGIILLPMLLILKQPDAGSTLVFCSLIFVLYREGLSPLFLIIFGLLAVLFVLSLLVVNQWYLIAGIMTAGLLLIWFVKRNRALALWVLLGTLLSVGFVFVIRPLYTHGLQSHQRERIDLVLGLTNDTKHVGYNQNQSKIAIGSGGMWGKGYLQGTQTKYSFVPEQSTDFIFCTVGEEWGFAGSIVVIGLFLFLLLRIIHVAERQRSPFSRIYGYGVASVIFFHFFINIAMTVGFMPVIGIPLPLISYGGSSLLSFTILIFTLIKLDSNRMGIV